MRVENKVLIFALLGLVFLLGACRDVIKTYPEQPTNPFDGIDYGDGVLDDLEFDSTSLLGLHEYIFSKSCAQPGCHDGNFEPDFRTIQGTYNTTVYHPVIKNDDDNTFTYRVVPGDTGLSWLHERITTDDPVLGRMPLYDTLYPQDIAVVSQWILDGAKDILGNSPIQPNYQPSLAGVLAFENDTSGYRYDTVRADAVSPIQLPPDTIVQLWFGLYDTENNGNFIPGYNLTFNKIKISPDAYYFDGVPFRDLSLEEPLEPFFAPPFFSDISFFPYYHYIELNTAEFDLNKPYFMRVYVQDADHSFQTEYPEDGSAPYLLTLVSFMVTP